MSTIRQIHDAGKSLNQGDVLSDALLEKLYGIQSDCQEPLHERQCYEQLKNESKSILEEALTRAADLINVTIGNASYFNWKRI